MGFAVALALLLVAAPAAAGTVEGTVFLDRDGDGVFSAGDEPVAGARVAFGATAFTRADAAGRYGFEVSDGVTGIVWVSVPRAGAPGPAWTFVPPVVGEATADLAIVPVDPGTEDDPVTFVVASDSHMDGVSGLWTPDDMAAALAQALALPAPARFFTVVGDITQANRPEDFAAVDRALAGLTVPWVPVPGNHDWYDGGAAWRAKWGPDAYSFTVGAIHVVVWNSSAPIDETLEFLRGDLDGIPAAATVIALGHEPPVDALAAQMRALGIDALFTGHWHANRVIDHDGMIELNTQPFVMGGIDLTPAGYRVVTLEADGLRVDHHAVVDAPVLRVVWPTEEHCHDGEVELLVAAALGSGLADVRARVGDASVRLAPVGGWLWRGTLPALAEGLHRIEVTASDHGDAGEIARVRAPVFSCDPDLTRTRATRDGAWPQQQGGATHAGAVPEAPALPFTHAWVASVGGHVHQGGPVVADGRVYVPVRDLAAGDRGGVVALSLTTGATLWRATTASPVRNSAAVADGAVVFATEDGRLHAVETLTGNPRWTVDLADGIDRTQAALWAAPTIADGVVYAGIQRRVAAVSLATGETLWTADPVPDGKWLGSFAAIAVTDELVIGAFNRTSGLTAWERDTGELRWRVTTEAVKAINAAPIVAGDRVLVGNGWGDAVALDLATGAQAWTAPLIADGHDWAYAVAASPAFADGRLFVPTQWDQLHALDAATGARLWSLAARPGPMRTAHYRGAQAGYQAGPVVAGDVVFAADTSGLLRAVDAATGAERWRYDLGVPVMGGLALAGDLLLVPTWDGAIHAFGPAPPQPPPPEPASPDGCASAGPLDVVIVLAWLVVLFRPRDRTVKRVAHPVNHGAS